MKNLSVALILALTAFAIAPANAGDRQIKIAAKNFAFVPASITLRVHQRTKLTFIGKEGTHGITIPELGVNAIVPIGTKPSTVVVTPGRVGTFTARCAVYCGLGHGNMVLTVHVIK